MSGLAEIRAAAEALAREARRFDACIDELDRQAAELRTTNNGLAAILQRARAEEAQPCHLSPTADRA